jgi:hypothetical protein
MAKRGRPRKRARERRTETAVVLLTTAEKRGLARLAEREGVSLSEYIRRAVAQMAREG